MFVFKSVIEISIFDSKEGVKVAGRVDFFFDFSLNESVGVLGKE